MPRYVVRSVEKPTRRKQAGQKKKKVVTFVPKIHSAEDGTALHYMFTYKIGTRRRHVNISRGCYNYGLTKCQDMLRTGRCPQGRQCRFAHNSLEVLFHPLFYKTKECSAHGEGKCSQGAECAFAHSEEEMREIAWDWRMKDPVSFSEKKAIRDKKEQRKSRRVRLERAVGRVGGDEEGKEQSAVVSAEASPSVSSQGDARRMSVSSSRAHSPRSSRTVTTEEAMSVSTSVSPGLKSSDGERTEMKEMVESEDGGVGATAGQEFEGWYRGTFNCEIVSYVHYLAQFQAKELNDVELLWDLYMESRRKKNNAFAALLAKEISMVDETARALFVRRLCQHKSPVDIRGWMKRVVGLPEYAELFVSSLGVDGRVDDLVHLGVDGDDLAEMGVSLVGHRMKILHHLKKFGEF